MENKEQAIAFAFYKNRKLIGFRQDTVGTIGMSPKIYHFNREQVNVVLSNINHNVKNKDGFGTLLRDALGADIPELIEVEENVHKMLQDRKVFEVRVVKAPDTLKKEFDVGKAKWVDVWEYPVAEIAEWLQHPEDHEVIETHYFSMEGLMQMQ